MRYFLAYNRSVVNMIYNEDNISIINSIYNKFLITGLLCVLLRWLLQYWHTNLFNLPQNIWRK